jgi:hypothetical protein
MKTIKRKQPLNSIRLSLLMFNERNKAGFIGKLRRVDEDTRNSVPFTDFCDLRDKVRELKKGKHVEV